MSLGPVGLAPASIGGLACASAQNLRRVLFFSEAPSDRGHRRRRAPGGADAAREPWPRDCPASGLCSRQGRHVPSSVLEGETEVPRAGGVSGSGGGGTGGEHSLLWGRARQHRVGIGGTRQGALAQGHSPPASCHHPGPVASDQWGWSDVRLPLTGTPLQTPLLGFVAAATQVLTPLDSFWKSRLPGPQSFRL